MKIYLVATLLLVAIGGSLLFGIAPHLLSIYVNNAPVSADPSSGHVYVFNQHGAVVYLSAKEQIIYGGLSVLGVSFLILAGATYRRWETGPT